MTTKPSSRPNQTEKELMQDAVFLLRQIEAEPKYLKLVYLAIADAYLQGYKRGANIALGALGAELLSEDF